jgi:hypothetical protein
MTDIGQSKRHRDKGDHDDIEEVTRDMPPRKRIK